MFSSRLPGELVDRVAEFAREEGISRADFTQWALEVALDAWPDADHPWPRRAPSAEG
jgi:hypothetical protein